MPYSLKMLLICFDSVKLYYPLKCNCDCYTVQEVVLFYKYIYYPDLFIWSGVPVVGR
jgi:hypothetical protein